MPRARRKNLPVDCDLHSTADGVCITCSRCSHVVEVKGVTPGIIASGFEQLRATCPRSEQNKYRDGDRDIAPDGE